MTLLRAVPSPNVWNWPDVYEIENRAQDVHGALWACLTFDGLDVVDVGCGDGFHLPVFAASAASVVGVEPHPWLISRALTRVRHLPNASVVRGYAERTGLPSSSFDLVHARTAYFFGPGCEPGLIEADRLLRPGGRLVIIDLDVGRSPYGSWLQADTPAYDPVAVQRFFDAQGFTTSTVDTEWRFPDRPSLENVLRIEFSAPVAHRAIAQTPGLSIPVAYRVHTRTKPTGLLRP